MVNIYRKRFDRVILFDDGHVVFQDSVYQPDEVEYAKVNRNSREDKNR